MGKQKLSQETKDALKEAEEIRKSLETKKTSKKAEESTTSTTSISRGLSFRPWKLTVYIRTKRTL